MVVSGSVVRFINTFGEDEPNVDVYNTSELTEKELARFRSNVDKTPGHGPWGDCWLWRGTMDRTNGYGRLSIRRGKLHKFPRVHKLAYLLANGSIPPGQSVLHMCDVRHCVNPEHLTAGSRAANSLDMVSKGRHYTVAFYGEEFPVGVRFRLAELATARGLTVTGLMSQSGLPPGAVMHIWYNRTPTVNLAVLTRLSMILEVEPGELLCKAA